MISRLGMKTAGKFLGKRSSVWARRGGVATFCAVGVALLGATLPARAVWPFSSGSSATYEVIYDFQNGSQVNDGAAPQFPLILGPDGSFYSVTVNGGTVGFGTIFKITPGGKETVLVNMGVGDAQSLGGPEAGLTLAPDGNFYGSCTGSGCSYKMSPDGKIQRLNSFGCRTENVVGPDGHMFAGWGWVLLKIGARHWVGNVDPEAYADSADQYDFSNDPQNNGVRNGPDLNKLTVLESPDGNLYGTSSAGGKAGKGFIYRLAYRGVPSLFQGARATYLHQFGDGSVPQDGETPYAPMIQATDGNFYGTTEDGGTAKVGVIYRITPDGKYSILHNFFDGSVANNGGQPDAGLLQATDGNFYGTTMAQNLPGAKPTIKGVIFRLTPQGEYTVLHVFDTATTVNGHPDGYMSCATLVQGDDGYLYGSCSAGGCVTKQSPLGAGVIFRLGVQGLIGHKPPHPQIALPSGTVHQTETASTVPAAAPSRGIAPSPPKPAASLSTPPLVASAHAPPAPFTPVNSPSPPPPPGSSQPSPESSPSVASPEPSPAPAPAPSSQGAAATPRQAILTFAHALESNDLATARSLYLGNAAEFDITLQSVKAGQAAKRFHDASLAKFGPAWQAPPVFPDADPLYDQATVTDEDGDKALMIIANGFGQTVYVPLLRVRGVWKFNIPKMANRQSAAQYAYWAKGIAAIAAACNEEADNVAAGKYDSAQAAYSELMSRIGALSQGGSQH